MIGGFNFDHCCALVRKMPYRPIHWSAVVLWSLSILQRVRHPFNGLFSRTVWVSRHSKDKQFWILIKILPLVSTKLGNSGISWTICKSFTPLFWQITTPARHHSTCSGRMLLLWSGTSDGFVAIFGHFLWLYGHVDQWIRLRPRVFLLFCSVQFLECMHRCWARNVGQTDGWTYRCIAYCLLP